MNLNYKGLINILGLQRWIDRLVTLETIVANLPEPDGNGIYSSSDTIPVGTLATVTESDGTTMDFAIGKFPSWPDFNLNDTEKGFWYGANYFGSLGLIYGDDNNNRLSSLTLGNTAVAMVARATNNSYFNSVTASSSSSSINCDIGNNESSIIAGPGYIRLTEKINNVSAAIDILMGPSAPEGVVSAGIGSIYINTLGGASTTLYIKTSGTGNTGWTAK